MSGTRKSSPSSGKGSGRGGDRARRGGPKDKKRSLRRPDGSIDWLLALRRLLILGIVGVLVLCAIFFFAYQRTTLPDPNAEYQSQTTFVYYADGKGKVGSFATQNRQSVPLGKISQSMQDAVVAAEDRTFWTNKGIDPKGIIRAAFSNAQGNATQGASTITQQYVKLLYLTQQRTFKRKIKEAFLSLKIQQQQSKQEILNGYLNTVYFGRGAYGVQAAAQAYFGIDADQLNARQSAMLASIINSPNYLSPTGSATQKQALLDRYQYVLHGMVSMQTLDASKAERIEGRLPKTEKEHVSNQYGGQRGFMLSLVKNELLKIGFSEQQIDGEGLRVTTTFNRRAMAAAAKAVNEVAPKGVRKLHVGVASVNVATGGLVGFYGGQDFLDSQLNYATRAAGSVGSSFKPFALAAALEQGKFGLKSTFDGNSPYEYPDGTLVHNEGEASGISNGQSYGSHVSLLMGLQESINTVFADLTVSMDNGPEAIKKMAIKMGIPDDNQLQATSNIALGSASISPANMANAYATIANGGVEHDWYVVSKVTDADGKVLWKHKAKTHRAMKEDVAADVSYALQNVVSHGTGTAALALGREAGGKTGTATNPDGDVDSAWFVGITPQIATAVSYLRGNGHESLEGYLVPYYGATYPARTWTATMSYLMENMPKEDFPPAANLTGTEKSGDHAPYVKPSRKPKPTKSAEPSKSPSPTKKATPSSAPPSPSHSPSPQPSHSASPPDPNCSPVGQDSYNCPNG